MAVRRVLWIVIALLSAIVLTGGGLVAWLLLRSQDNPVRLVVMGSDTTVRLIDSGGGRSLSSQGGRLAARRPALRVPLVRGSHDPARRIGCAFQVARCATEARRTSLTRPDRSPPAG